MAQSSIKSKYVHTSFLGPARFTIVGDETIHIDVNPNPTEGIAALRWGLFCFVRGVDAVLRLVGLDADSERIVDRYAAVRDLAGEELRKAQHNSGSDLGASETSENDA